MYNKYRNVQKYTQTMHKYKQTILKCAQIMQKIYILHKQLRNMRKHEKLCAKIKLINQTFRFIMKYFLHVNFFPSINTFNRKLVNADDDSNGVDVNFLILCNTLLFLRLLLLLLLLLALLFFFFRLLLLQFK